MPKYKRDEEDWLDDEEETSRPLAKSKNSGRKVAAPDFLSWDQANGLVVEVFPGFCSVIPWKETDPSNPTETWAPVLCTYRKAKLPASLLADRAPVAVGDRVGFEKTGGNQGVVTGVARRKNALFRPAPERNLRHVLTTNLSQLAIVASVTQPDFSIGVVDRFYIAAKKQGIPSILILSKVDLAYDDQPELWKIYESLGVKVFPVSSVTGEGLDKLKESLQEEVTAFCGHSGVGKTSILNRLQGESSRKTGEVNDFTGKGKHTTTGAYWVPSTHWIDTPGIRAFGIEWGKDERIADYFPELGAFGCPPHCNHLLEEEGCNARHSPRYASYLKLMERDG